MILFGLSTAFLVPTDGAADSSSGGGMNCSVLGFFAEDCLPVFFPSSDALLDDAAAELLSDEEESDRFRRLDLVAIFLGFSVIKCFFAVFFKRDK